MEESSKVLGQNEEENDEDNMGRDKYFMMERDDDLSEINLNGDEDSKNTIQTVENYINDNNNEVNEMAENSIINIDLSIIDNKIEENTNMKNSYASQNKSLSKINNVSDNNTIFNNNNLNEYNNKNYFGNTNLLFKEEENNKIYYNQNINRNEIINFNSKNDDENPIVISSDDEEEEGDDKDIEIITGEQYIKYFQEDRNGPQRKIKIIEPEEEHKNIIMQNKIIDNMKKIKEDKDKVFDNFFQKKKIENNKNEITPKKNNNFIFYKKRYKFYNRLKTKVFIPIKQNNFRANKFYDKLLINRVEHQILTNIYNSYEDKSKFNTTYNYITKLRNVIINQGVKEAIKYLDNIEPIELRNKIAIESTYFFKEIIREEVENAKIHQGELILIKQPEYKYNKSIMNLCGKINCFRGNSNNRIMKNNKIYDNYNMNNHQKINCNNINENNNEKYKINFFNNNQNILQGNNIIP